MRPFTLLVKPASADCNLRCSYCFYLDKSRLYPESSRHRMSEAVLERMIQTYMATDQPAHTVGWQGGEPTLMGLDFFRKVTDFQQRHGRPGAVVGNGLQTNATLLDDDWAEHLARFHFLVGCSLDGPPDVHDRYRRTPDGRPTHDAVLRGIGALRRHHVDFNILVLVSQANVRRAAEVYRYLVSEGFLYHQYIPCVEFDASGRLQPFAIAGDAWGDFLCALFDAWYAADVFTVSVRHFDSILLRIVDGVSNVCSMDRNCCQYFVVEHNGDIYPCDFFVEPGLKLGNVMTTTWAEAMVSPVYREFGDRKARWNAACTACEALDVCAGDCVKHRNYAGNPPENLSWLCRGWKRFHDHTRERFRELADRIRARRREENARRDGARAGGVAPATRIPGRNDPCPCGSGRKFKKCCGR